MRQFLKYFVVIILLIIIIGYGIVFHGLPKEDDIISYSPTSTVINLDDLDFQLNMPMAVRFYVPITHISADLQQCVIISEDDEFYRHEGLNMDQLQNVLEESLQEGRLTRGASTITMQLARTVYLSNERSLLRKIREIIIARRMENVLSKRRILELYLNLVEWGPNIYGIEAASWYYFDKSAYQLDLAESSLLAAILINPRRFNPHYRLESARKLQQRVLKLLRDSHKISDDELEYYLTAPLLLRIE